MNSERIHAYLNAAVTRPDQNLGWPLYGSGVDSLGKEGKPVSLDLPCINDGELLMRIDAVSLCYTDLKEIDQGPSHPRLTGRDLASNPIVPGHEVCMTVLKAGETLKDEYQAGQRFTLQPDVWVDGKSIPFCFGMDGGYRQYAVIGKDILSGDAGNYLIPIPPTMSYAAAAITEPWACVEASYRMVYRRNFQHGGAVLFLGGERSRSGYQIEKLWGPDYLPAQVYTASLPEDLLNDLLKFCGAYHIPVVQADREQLEELDLHLDDIILLDCSREDIDHIDCFTGKNTVVAILAEAPMDGEIEIDLGKLHYDNLSIVGSSGLDIDAAYQATPIRVDLKPGGIAWILGAGGPMGRMHLQRAIESPNGPKMILATEITEDRLLAMAEFFVPLAEQHNKVLRILNPVAQEKEFADLMRAVCAMGGVDDVEIMVAHPAAIAQAQPYLTHNGVVNVFAGLKRGVKACVNPWLIYGPRQVRFTGHSGSDLADQKAVVERAVSSQLKPELSVAAIGGLNQIPDGIRAMKNWVYPGKIIIYPHVLDFPITALSDLNDTHPDVYAALGPGSTWSREAERIFLNEVLS